MELAVQATEILLGKEKNKLKYSQKNKSKKNILYVEIQFNSSMEDNRQTN